MDGSHSAGKPGGNPKTPALCPSQNSPECFVKGQASEVKEAEILLCYQLAKFVTVIKEGVVSPFIREEDTVHKRNSGMQSLGQPNPARHCRCNPRPRETCSWPEMLLEDLPDVPTASPRHLRMRDTCPAALLCCAAGQAIRISCAPPAPGSHPLLDVTLPPTATFPLSPPEAPIPRSPQSTLLLWQMDAAGDWSRGAQMSSRQGLLALPRELDSVTKPQKADKPLETANSCVSRGSVT